MSAPAGPDAGAGRAPLRLAHRGDHRAVPENTLAAFRAALAVPSCDGLELDVRLSRDGVPVVLHDETLERVHGVPGRAADLTAAEMAAHGVPTLAEILAAVPSAAFLDVELKQDCGPAGVEALEAGRGLPGGGLANAVVSSFEPDALATVLRLRPGWPAWLNADDLSDGTIGLAVRLGCRGIAAERHAVDAGARARVAAAGLELAAWTVRSEVELERLAALGAVAICVEDAALDAPRASVARRAAVAPGGGS